MHLKYIFLFFLFFAIYPATAYETISGVDENSFEYQQYKTCFDSCAQCEANCKNNLLRNLAETRLDENFCKQLPAEMQLGCLDNVYSRKAIEQNDIALCDKVSAEDEKQRCRMSIAIAKALRSENAAECDVLGEMAAACKSSFYFSMALNKLDESYCNNLDAVSKDNCVLRVKEQKQTQLPVEQPAAESQMPVAEEKKSLRLILLYAGIGAIAIFILLFAIILIRKRGKKPEEVPLVLQKASEQGVQQNAQPAEVQQNIQGGQK